MVRIGMAKIFGNLGQENSVALVNKEAQGSSIAIHVAAGKALKLRCDKSMKF